MKRMRNYSFKSFLFLLLLLPLSFCAFSQGDDFIEVKPKYRPRSDKGHYNKYDLTGKAWGLHKVYNRNKQLVAETEYERGIKNGTYTKYHAITGKPLEVRNYAYGKLDGPYEKYTALGELLIEGEYILGKKTGAWTYNYSSGAIRTTGNFVNNLKEGNWESYNKKGDLTRTIFYTNGKPPAAPEPPKEKKEDKETKDPKKKVIKKKVTPASPSPSPKPSPKPN